MRQSVYCYSCNVHTLNHIALLPATTEMHTLQQSALLQRYKAHHSGARHCTGRLLRRAMLHILCTTPILTTANPTITHLHIKAAPLLHPMGEYQTRCFYWGCSAGHLSQFRGYYVQLGAQQCSQYAYVARDTQHKETLHTENLHVPHTKHITHRHGTRTQRVGKIQHGPHVLTAHQRVRNRNPFQPGRRTNDGGRCMLTSGSDVAPFDC